MDILKKCAEIFEKYTSKKCTFVLDCNMTVDVIFNTKQFHHLVGLQYLTDIAQVDTRGKGNSSSYIYKQILKKRISHDTIKFSSFYGDIEDRLKYFLNFDDVVNSKIIVDFDYTKLQTKILSKYLLYRQYGDIYVILGLRYSEKYNAYVPETFIIEPSDYYIKNQVSYNIIDIKYESLKK